MVNDPSARVSVPTPLRALCWRLVLLMAAVFGPGLHAGPSAAAAGAELRALRVQSDAGTTRLLLDLSGATEHRFFMLEGPRRAVIDLEGVADALRGPPPAPGGSIVAVRTGARPGGALRVVVELREGAVASMGPPLARGAAGQRLVLEVDGTPEASSQQAASQQAAVPPSAPSTLKPIKAAHAPVASGRTVVVAIDPGHGGQDPGAIGPAGTREKDVVLDISKTLAERINREPGMRAFLTRDGDYFLSLRERIRRAQAAGAMLFVSVHADAVRDPTVTGSSVYVLSDKGATDEQARMLADRENAADLAGGVSIDDKDAVLASILVDVAQSAQIGYSMAAAERVLRALRDVNVVRKPLVQQAGFVVLKSPDIPSMLVETAFISSPEDERLLGQPERRAALAEAIFAGIRQYFVDHPPDGSRFAESRPTGRL